MDEGETLYLLTIEPDDIESGTFATCDDDGGAIIQFFKNKDDATTYATQLEAVGVTLYVSETNEKVVDKFCDVNNFAYSVAEEGELVIPRMETLQFTMDGHDLISRNRI
jgi:hypothetical protein